MKSKMRILWGFILFFTGVFSFILGGYFLAISLGLGCYLAGIEYINLAKAKGTRPSIRIVKAMIIAFIITASIPGLGIPAFKDFSPLAHFPILLTTGICLSFFRLLFRHENPPATNSDIATTILGFIYLGFLPCHLILLRNLCPHNIVIDPSKPWLDPGVAYLWATMFTIWSTDVFAYYAGKIFGKNLLYPQVSPKKTVEGSIGGLIAAIFFNTLVFYLSDNYIFKCHPFNFQLIQAPFMAIMVSVAAQLGDLCESLLKRDAGVKNSSEIIPGHGGLLDRGDSVLFGGAIAYYWISLLILHNW